MYFILLNFIFYLHSISCQDLCSVIAPNGQYVGTGLYKRFDADKGSGDYWLDNKQGLEWKVKITDDITLGDMDLDSKRKMSKDIVKRFGLFFEKLEFEVMLSLYEIAVNCGIYSFKEGQWTKDRTVICVFNIDILTSPYNTTSTTYFKEDVTKSLIGDRVFVKPEPSRTSDGNYMLSINKRNRSDRLILEFNYKEFDKKSDITFKPCMDTTGRCSRIEFLEQLEDSLLGQLDSIVEFQRKGHILWFHIDGRPYYCFQPEGQSLSDQCSAKDKLRQAFKQCFNDTDGFDEKIWIKVALISVITVIVIAIIAIVIYCLIRRKVSETTISKSSAESKPSHLKGSVTQILDREHNRFIESKTNESSNIGP